MIQWHWIRTVLVGPAPPPPMDITSPKGLCRGFSLLGLIVLLLIFTSMTLPTAGTKSGLIRLAILPLLLYLSLTLAVGQELVTFGAPLRDCFWPLIAWSLMAKGVDVCLSGTVLDRQEAQRCPRWIVPASQADKWPEAIKLETEEKAMDKSKHDHDLLTAGGADPCDRVETDWYLIPHTSHLMSLRRVLWACDHIFLLRPQTSWILPREQRAMEWAHHSLARASMDPPLSLYGKPEDGSLLSIVPKMALLGWLVWNSHLLVVPPGAVYYQMPMYVQLFNVLFYGSLICATSGPFEYLAFPLLRRLLPSTALLPLMDQPLLAKGPADLWGKRWHTMVRRSSWRLARLLPGGHHSLGNKLWAFVITGSMHSFILARWLPQPPNVWYALVFLVVPGPMAFFVAQGLIVAIEVTVFGPTTAVGSSEGRKVSRGRVGCVKAVVRRMLLWTGIAVTCRYFVGAIAAAGMHTREGQRGGQPW